MPASHSIARGIRELIVGQDPQQIDRLWQLMFHGSDHYGRGGAALHVISAIDMALWDLAGKAAGKPVADLLGGRRLDEVPVYASEVMPETPNEVQRIAERAAAAGYTALKLGWGPLGRSLEGDVELIAAARDTLGPERSLMVDGGRAYTVKSALELLRHVEEQRLYWFEEALAPDDLHGYRRLADAAAVRIAAGEADSGIRPFRALVEQGHVDVLQPDVARCGGFTVARQIAELARELPVEVVPHCFSTGVLVAASLHFVAMLDRPTWSEFSVADSPLVNGILATPFELRDGKLRVPTGPGLGIELDDELVERMRVN
jgi:L-alanine-DL-glutamate epimerase-like enolase superfamily enzyme